MIYGLTACLLRRLRGNKIDGAFTLAIAKDPKEALVICFGMGASFRSALSHGINVDVVEIVPSVVSSFGYFHEDAREVLSNPKGRVIINDGRNYVSLTDKKYDVITLDPSPPIYSAGTVNLYTFEFFRECRRLLNDSGMICLWVPACKKEEYDLILKAFSSNFYTTIWYSFQVPGTFIVGAKDKFYISRERFVKSLSRRMCLKT